MPNDRESLRKFWGLPPITANSFPILTRLHSLTEKAKSWQWSQQCNEAFDQLVKLLSPPILSFPQFDKVFVVDTDASHLAKFCPSKVIVLSPIRVWFLQRTSANTVQIDMRCLNWCGLFAAIDHISGAMHRFVVRTDRNLLQWLRNFKDLQGQVTCWMDILVGYGFFG